MVQTSQEKLLGEASELQSLLRQKVSTAYGVKRGLEQERDAATQLLVKLRAEHASFIAQAAIRDVSAKEIEVQVARLSEQIVGLGAVLQSVHDGGLVKAPAGKLALPSKTATPAKGRYVATGAARRSMQGAEERRQAIVAVCSAKPASMGDLRSAFPKLTGNTLRPMVSLMVTEGRLKRTGEAGSYLYVPGPKGPPKDFEKRLPPPAPSVVEKTSKLAATSEPTLRDNILRVCVEKGPLTALDLYPIFPKANRHTIQSALSELVSRGKLSHAKQTGDRFFSYGPPSMRVVTAAPSGSAPKPGTQMDAVLAVCRQAGLTFGEVAEKLPNINRHVLHQAVHALVNSKRLLRSGERNNYVYTSA